MEITNINLGACPLQYLSIGYVGETGARPVAFDFSAWATEYGSGVLQLLLQRPGDADPYPVVLDIDGTTATWTPDATATEKTGQGQAQLVYTVGGVIVKNAIFRVLIAPSLGAAGNPPEPYENWLERLLTIAAEAQQSAIDAAGSAEAAGTSAGAAAGSAGAAAQSALDAEAAKTAAETAEQTAQQAATLARAKAAEAAEAAQIAGREADYAQQQNIAAGYSAESAHDDAERAAQSSEDAQAAASAAQTAATAAGAAAADAAATVTEVETKGAQQIQAIGAAGTEQIQAVAAAGTEQIDAVQEKGEEVIASIPSDYTELIDEVSDLKSSLYDPRTGLTQKAGLLRDTAEGAVASFVPDASVENLLGLTVDIEPVQAGSGDPSPDNVRPISGWDDVEVEADGVNLWDEQWESGDYTDADGQPHSQGTRIRTKNPIHCKPSTTYYFSLGGKRGQLFYYDRDDNFISTTSWIYDGQTFTTPSNCHLIRFYLVATTEYTEGVGINYPSTDHAYHPYAGNRYTIPLGDTVYGAKLTIAEDGSVNALVDRAVYTITGNEAFGSFEASANTSRCYFSSDRFSPRIRPNNSTVCKILCDTLPAFEPDYIYRNDTQGISENKNATSNGFWIRINNSLLSESTLAGMKAFFAQHPITVCYYLATPIEIQLYPVTIAAIAGQTNNVWADAGDVSVEFAADLKHYIDSKIAAAVAALS